MSEEKQAGGQILAVARKEKNFSLMIGDNNWYSGWNDKFKEELVNLDKGDRVDLTYIENQSGDRVFKNIVEGKLKITKADLKPEYKEPNKESPYEKKEEEKREDILRSVALKGSIELIRHCMTNAGESDEEKTERVLKIADKMLDWLKSSL